MEDILWPAAVDILVPSLHTTWINSSTLLMYTIDNRPEFRHSRLMAQYVIFSIWVI